MFVRDFFFIKIIKSVKRINDCMRMQVTVLGRYAPQQFTCMREKKEKRKRKKSADPNAAADLRGILRSLAPLPPLGRLRIPQLAQISGVISSTRDSPPPAAGPRYIYVTLCI